jgi:hypothetical protein
LIRSSSHWFISLALILPAAAQKCAPVPKDLAAWFTFDEPMFERGVNRIPGHVGHALHFNGRSDYVNLPDQQRFKVGEGDFSVELWMRTQEKAGVRNVVEFRDGAPKGWLVFIRRGAVGVQIADHSFIADTIADKYPIADGKWHHVVATIKRLPPQPARIYVDGVLRAQTGRNVPLSNLDHAMPLWLARHRKNSIVARDDIFFPGDLDELSVYRRALTAAEIAAIYRAGRAGKCRQASR